MARDRMLGMVALLVVAGTWLASEFLAHRPGPLPPDVPLPVGETAVGRATARLALGMKVLTSPKGPVAYAAPIRNPFEFGALQRPSAQGTTTDRAAALPAADRAKTNLFPERPAMQLSGIAEDPGPHGPVRRAVIAAADELFVVGNGDLVLGRFRVVQIDPEAVELEDLQGGPKTILALR